MDGRSHREPVHEAVPCAAGGRTTVLIYGAVSGIPITVCNVDPWTGC